VFLVESVLSHNDHKILRLVDFVLRIVCRTAFDLPNYLPDVNKAVAIKIRNTAAVIPITVSRPTSLGLFRSELCGRISHLLPHSIQN